MQHTWRLSRRPTSWATTPSTRTVPLLKSLLEALAPGVTATNEPRRVWINKTQYFEGVPPHVWEFQIGGYQVAEKWLKDRKGRALGYDDLEHYRSVVSALAETMRLMEEIDEAIPGWPVE